MKILALLVLAIGIASCQKTPSYFKTDSAKHPKAIHSAPIEWEVAARMLETYESHPNRLLTKNGDGEIVTFQGTRVDTASLKKILLDKTVKDIVIYFGVHPNDLENNPEDQYFTTIIAGVDGDNKLVKYAVNEEGSRTTTSAVYDYCDPCPDNCPVKEIVAAKK